MSADAMVIIKFHPCETKTTESGRSIHPKHLKAPNADLPKMRLGNRLLCYDCDLVNLERGTDTQKS